MDKQIDKKRLAAFERYLCDEEREPGTIEKYLRDVRSFSVWLDRRELSKEAVVAWKEHLRMADYVQDRLGHDRRYAILPFYRRSLRCR